MLKRAQYPIKQLWPKPVLKRYLSFNDAFWNQRSDMLDHYEQSGGDYHGADEDETSEEVESKEYDDLTLGCDKDFWVLFMSIYDIILLNISDLISWRFMILF